jgi:hypothetical protein
MSRPSMPKLLTSLKVGELDLLSDRPQFRYHSQSRNKSEKRPRRQSGKSGRKCEVGRGVVAVGDERSSHLLTFHTRRVEILQLSYFTAFDDR